MSTHMQPVCQVTFRKESMRETASQQWSQQQNDIIQVPLTSDCQVLKHDIDGIFEKGQHDTALSRDAQVTSKERHG